MKCDGNNCNKEAEFGVDGEETVLCHDCYVEQEGESDDS